MKKLVYILLALVLVSSLMLAACATEKPGATGGWLKMTKRVNPRNMYPPEMSGGSTGYLAYVCESLVKYDENFDFAPWLATEWELAADGLSYTFKLRKGVKFTDGTDFNAAAAKYSLEARKAAKQGDLNEMDSVDIIDNYTIRMNLNTFTNALFHRLTAATGMMFSPTYYSTHTREEVMWEPVGTGPFKLVAFERDAYLRYVKNENYWQEGKPYLDGVELHIIADPMTNVTAFRAGDVNVASDVDRQFLAELVQEGMEGHLDLAFNQPLCPDSKNPESPFADIRVRQAVVYSIDHAKVASATGYGLFQAPTQFVSTEHPWYMKGENYYPYDPAKARQLLAEAGYPNGFETQILFLGSMPTDSIQACANYMAEVGIDAKLVACDTSKWVADGAGGWTGLWVAVHGITNPNSLVNLESAYKATADVSRQLPDGFTELLNKGFLQTDPDEAKKIAQQLFRMLGENMTDMPMYLYGRGTAFDNTKIHNFDWGYQSNRVYGPEDTWISQ